MDLTHPPKEFRTLREHQPVLYPKNTFLNGKIRLVNIKISEFENMPDLLNLVDMVYLPVKSGNSADVG